MVVIRSMVPCVAGDIRATLQYHRSASEHGHPGEGRGAEFPIPLHDRHWSA